MRNNKATQLFAAATALTTLINAASAQTIAPQENNTADAPPTKNSSNYGYQRGLSAYKFNTKRNDTEEKTEPQHSDFHKQCTQSIKSDNPDLSCDWSISLQ